MVLSSGAAFDPRLDIYADDNVIRDAAVTARVQGAETPAHPGAGFGDRHFDLGSRRFDVAAIGHFGRGTHASW